MEGEQAGASRGISPGADHETLVLESSKGLIIMQFPGPHPYCLNETVWECGLRNAHC